MKASGRRPACHAGLVAEDRSAGAGRRRVDGQHRHPVSLLVRCVPSASMKVDLPTPGTPVMPTRWRCPRRGMQVQRAARCARSRWSARVDSTRVIARGNGRAVAGADPVGQSVSIDRSRHRPQSSYPSRSASLSQQLDRGLGDHRARREDRRGAGRVQLVEVLGRDHAADHDQDVGPRRARPAPRAAAGTRVRCPAASDDTPTTCTSFSTAWRAASSGVWNSGPTSTSKPRSAKAVAMTFWPRSWPSWPILATRIRGRRPSASANCSTSSVRTALDVAARSPDLVAVHAGDGADLGLVAAVDLLQGVADLADGGLGPGRVDRQRQQVVAQAAVAGRQRAARRGRARPAPRALPSSRSARSCSSLAICSARTRRCRP